MSEGLDVVFKKHITDTFGKYIVFCANAEHIREMISHTDEWFGGIDPTTIFTLRIPVTRKQARLSNGSKLITVST